MLMLIGLSLLMNLVGMGMQLAFYACAAYLVAKYARKGWKAGK